MMLLWWLTYFITNVDVLLKWVMDQFGSKWINLAQNGSISFNLNGLACGSNLITLVSGSIWLKIILVQMGSNWSKLVQIGSNLIYLVQNGSIMFKIDRLGSNWIQTVLDFFKSCLSKIEQCDKQTTIKDMFFNMIL